MHYISRNHWGGKTVYGGVKRFIPQHSIDKPIGERHAMFRRGCHRQAQGTTPGRHLVTYGCGRQTPPPLPNCTPKDERPASTKKSILSSAPVGGTKKKKEPPVFGSHASISRISRIFRIYRISRISRIFWIFWFLRISRFFRIYRISWLGYSACAGLMHVSLDFIMLSSSHCLSESTKDYKIQGFWFVLLQRQAWLKKTIVKSKDFAQQIKSSKDSLGISKDSKDFALQSFFWSKKLHFPKNRWNHWNPWILQWFFTCAIWNPWNPWKYQGNPWNYWFVERNPWILQLFSLTMLAVATERAKIIGFYNLSTIRVGNVKSKTL